MVYKKYIVEQKAKNRASYGKAIGDLGSKEKKHEL